MTDSLNSDNFSADLHRPSFAQAIGSTEKLATLERIFLTGFMGAGKSTIGKILAQRMGYRFHDTDYLVIKGFRKPVSRIFKENGEEAFRRAELMVLRELAKRSRVVVSTGGGTLARDEPFAVAREAGTLVYLYAPIATLYERVIFSPKERPIIDVPDTESVFLQRFEQRIPYYERADIKIDTQERRPDDVVQEILERMNWNASI